MHPIESMDESLDVMESEARKNAECPTMLANDPGATGGPELAEDLVTPAHSFIAWAQPHEEQQ